MAVNFMPIDTVKVMDQSRLVVTAILTTMILGRKFSRSTWNMLCIVTFGAIMYSYARTTSTGMAAESMKMDQLVLGGKADWGGQSPWKDLNGKDEISLSRWLRTGLKKDGTPIISTQFKSFSDFHAKFTEPKVSETNYLVGILCVLCGCMSACIANIAAEKSLKDYASQPLYVQKIFLELPAIPVQLLISFVIMPALSNVESLKTVLAKTKTMGDFETNAFWHGWNPVTGNTWLAAMFLTFWLKCYIQGMCMKKLDSVVKQVCVLAAGVLTFPFNTIHSCGHSFAPVDFPEGAERYPHAIFFEEKWSQMQRATHFFCFSDMGETAMGVWMALVLVLFSAAGYTLALRDKQRKLMFKKQIGEISD
jgi:hypothetical protein